jgi:RHH-type rel operon transcriptional repressor/antitoxin RelB
MIALNLPPEIEDRLDALAATTGRSKVSFLEEAIVEYLSDLEDLYLAEQEFQNIKSGASKTKPLSEVMKQYGLEN